MNHKARYELSVREQDVTITFSKINDSRKLTSYSEKKPNLFNIRGVTLCALEVPPEMSPSWWKSTGKDCYLTGYAFCTWMDKWNSQTGRHYALRHAMRDLKDKEVRLEIWAAFEAEEKLRTKERGPARTPKTAKPKVRKPRPPAPGGIHETLNRIADSLQTIANPMIQAGPVYTGFGPGRCTRCGAPLIEGIGCPNTCCTTKFTPPFGTAAMPEENTL